MTQAEALRLAAYLAGAYRNSDSSDGALAVLADQLLDLDHDRARGVVREIVAAGGAFAPSAGEIRNAYFASVHNLPSVAAIVNEIADARDEPIADAEFSHPIVREVALQVGYAKIREEWGFAHREVQSAAEGLHAEFLRAVNVGSLTGKAPKLKGRLALAARGLDYFQKPPPPQLPEGWTWSGWGLHREGDVLMWRSMASSKRMWDSAEWTCPMLYEGLDASTIPVPLGAGGAQMALPTGGWTTPVPTRTRFNTVELQRERDKREDEERAKVREANAIADAKRAEVERRVAADPALFKELKALTAFERVARVRQMMAEVVLPTPTPPTEARA